MAAPLRARTVGRGFRFGSCLSENDRPSRPIPCGPCPPARPRRLMARRGDARQLDRHYGGLRRKRKSEGCRTPHAARRTAHTATRSQSTAPCLTAIPWWEPTLSAIPRQRARLRQAPIADRVGSHQSDGHPNGGCCLCRTTPQCSGEPSAATLVARCGTEERRAKRPVGGRPGRPAVFAEARRPNRKPRPARRARRGAAIGHGRAAASFPERRCNRSDEGGGRRLRLTQPTARAKPSRTKPEHARRNKQKPAHQIQPRSR